MIILYVCYYYHFCVKRSENMAEARNNYNFKLDHNHFFLSVYVLF